MPIDLVIDERDGKDSSSTMTKGSHLSITGGGSSGSSNGSNNPDSHTETSTQEQVQQRLITVQF